MQSRTPGSHDHEWFAGGYALAMGIVIALAIVGFAVVIGLAVLSSAANQKRATALRDWALQRDYSYTESDHSLGRLYQSLPYERGSRVDFDNVIRGRLGGRPLTIFDYSYRTTETHQSTSATRMGSNGMGGTGMGGTSTSTSTHRLKVVSIDLPPSPARDHGRGLGVLLEDRGHLRWSGRRDRQPGLRSRFPGPDGGPELRP